MNLHIKKILLLAGDIVILYLSLFLTLLVRYFSWPTAGGWHQHLMPFSLVFIVWILLFYISELYNLHIAVNNSEFFNKVIRAVGIAGLISALFFYLNPNIDIAPKTNLIIYLVLFTIIFIFWRRFFNWSLNTYLPKENIAFVGCNDQVKELVFTLKKNPHLGYRVSLIVSNNLMDMIEGIRTSHTTKDLSRQISRLNISTIILATDPQKTNQLRTELFSCLPHRVSFVSLPSFYEIVTGKVPIQAITEMWFLENLSEGNKKWFDFFKRSYDIFIAFFILIITALFWPIIGLILKIENKEPIFFVQTRAGRYNKPFRLIKFRTQRSMMSNPAPAVKNDSRTTRVGMFLRRARIDEIPQVINILRGEMSFIGPRPERPELIKDLEKSIPFYHERLLVKPGLTGWDQVSGEYHSPSKEDTLKKLQYDLFYIKNRSVYLDLSIVLKTIATIFSRAGL